MAEQTRLRGGGLFAAEMELRLSQNPSEPYRSHILQVDAILANYREQVAADAAKRAPSGQSYYAAWQLAERRAEHARVAREQIDALRPVGLDTRIDNLRTRLTTNKAPTYDERRVDRIRSELAPIKDTPLELRQHVISALRRGDGEFLAAVMEWPGRPRGELLGDRWHSDKLLPQIERWLQTHQAPEQHRELSELMTYDAQLTNVRATAIQELEREVPAIVLDPIAAQAAGEPHQAQSG
jgi:hypothetical protein